MILAAGRGERMRPLSDRAPKPLLALAGKPLIVWHVENLVRAGFCDLVINVSHLAGKIEAALGDGGRFGARIVYSREAQALEAAGGIAQALPLLGEAPFAVVNGDIYTDYDFARLAVRGTGLARNENHAHLVLVDNPAHHPQGDFALDAGMVAADGARRLTFSGVAVYQPALFQRVPRGAKAQLAPLLRQAIAERRVSGEHHAGLWFDVGTPERLRELQQRLER